MFMVTISSNSAFPHKRRIKYILKEQLIGDALDEAEYNTDEDVMNILSLLSLQMQGYRMLQMEINHQQLLTENNSMREKMAQMEKEQRKKADIRFGADEHCPGRD
ncbi:hypothetical protein niasHT_005948 [Heterodera trifolii]|uniref:Uncharacterized protein n=1 Tax=Heterodera trifolii TaxID=157864 RepID=A0ABD2MEZ8_9BILA